MFSITLCFCLWENMFNLPCPGTLWIIIKPFFFSTFSRLLCINVFHCPCEAQSSSVYLHSLCRWNTVVFEIFYWAFLSTTMFPKHIIAVQGSQTQCEQCCENAFSTQVSLNETTYIYCISAEWQVDRKENNICANIQLIALFIKQISEQTPIMAARGANMRWSYLMCWF